MSGQALYRKYRSADFSQVIGQDHVVKTLTAALSSDRIGHAYLFTGPRGVGKTSVARLLARALNCRVEGGAARPCNQCESCLVSINSSLDVVEIDAASNNGVDDVRELRDKIALAPAGGRYKVYIIDEVHMLSSGAFNALLKTLEEPPAHAVFILATTEAHKLPETIISRTQRYNFRPIGDQDITAHLAKIAAREGVEADADALALIAATARGGFRDAIGMLDQVAAGGGTVTAAAVRELLGIADAEAINTINEAIIAYDPRQALGSLLSVLDQGSQPGQLAMQMMADWRGKLLSALGLEAGRFGGANPRRISEIIETLMAVSKSPWPRESLEIAVVRLAAPAAAVEPSGGANAAAVEPAVKRAAAPAAPSAPTKTAAVSPATASSPAAPPPTAPLPTAAPTSALDPALWAKVLSGLRRSNNSLSALLQMYQVDFDNDKVTIKARFNFHRDLFLKPVNRRAIEEVAQKVYGRHVPVHAVTEDDKQPKPSRQSTENELVSTALDILGGEVIE